MNNSLSFHEIMPQDIWKWKYMESQIEQVLCLYNYREIQLSILQDYEKLRQGIAAMEDAEKTGKSAEQLLFLDKSDQDAGMLSLRPEGTIYVLHHVTGKMDIHKIHRIFYHGPMFRRNQRHEPTEFYQLGVELLGSDSILSENEVIGLGIKICTQLGLKDAWLDLNCYGCKSCRPLFSQAMRSYLENNKDEFGQSWFEQLHDNPLLATECDDLNCSHNANKGPQLEDYLCNKCRNNYERVKKIQANLAHNYKDNKKLCSQFSYYNETVFNYVVQVNGTSEVIGGGGRYDYLSESVTGKRIPAVGFYLNMDAVFRILSHRNLFHKPENPFRVHISTQSEDMEIILLQIVQELHQQGISTLISSDINDTETDTGIALENDCHAMVILRSDNIREGKILLKNLVKDKQVYIKLVDLLSEVDLIRKSMQYL